MTEIRFVDSRTANALREFDWNRYRDLGYLDAFFTKWGFEPFTVPEALKPAAPVVIEARPMMYMPVEPCERAFRQYGRSSRFFDPKA